LAEGVIGAWGAGLYHRNLAISKDFGETDIRDPDEGMALGSVACSFRLTTVWNAALVTCIIWHRI